MLTPKASVTLVQGAADKRVPQMVRAFTTTVARMRDRVTDDMVTADMGPGEPVETLSVLAGWEVTKKATDVRDPVGFYADILSDVALGTVAGSELAGRLEAALQVQSPFVHQAAQTLTGNLITNVTQETRQAVRDVIHQAWIDGRPPKEAAPLVRETIGLSKRQARQLLAFTRNLQGEPDQRKRTAGFARRLHKQRALVIARTETLTAANRGQQLAWQEMRAQGVLPSGFRQMWITTPDDRLCPTCAPMSGQTVALNSPFVSSERGVLPSERVAYVGGVTESPPLHPQCRCCLGAAF